VQGHVGKCPRPLADEQGHVGKCFCGVKIDEACRKIPNCVTATNKQNRRVEITIIEEK